MIKISVDESDAFDRLAILKVKENKNNITDPLYKVISIDIIKQIGKDKFFEIINSEEFSLLVDINEEIYDIVDMSKNNEVTAKFVDERNFERHRRKRSLQKRFFANIEMTEKKFNYELFYQKKEDKKN